MVNDGWLVEWLVLNITVGIMSWFIFRIMQLVGFVNLQIICSRCICKCRIPENNLPGFAGRESNAQQFVQSKQQAVQQKAMIRNERTMAYDLK